MFQGKRVFVTDQTWAPKRLLEIVVADLGGIVQPALIHALTGESAQIVLIGADSTQNQCGYYERIWRAGNVIEFVLWEAKFDDYVLDGRMIHDRLNDALRKSWQSHQYTINREY